MRRSHLGTFLGTAILISHTANALGSADQPARRSLPAGRRETLASRRRLCSRALCPAVGLFDLAWRAFIAPKGPAVDPAPMGVANARLASYNRSLTARTEHGRFKPCVEPVSQSRCFSSP